jgi:Reverse transcriptase (RNA-dependent DNA polymerase)
MMAVERDPSLHEPSSFQEAISTGESSHWQASMKREVKQLEEQGAWKVVSELPLGRKLIKGRWVYKKKLNPDNTIKEYKSRWVVKGFMQQEGVDYFDTYAATLFPTTFRSVFSLVASRGWKLYQMDVTGAFLHSLIDSEIYMEPPEGFYQKGLICKMEKSIYGLKQAPYLWFESLSKVLTDLGYHSLQSDRCCFTNDAKDVIILVFVDDIQVTGPNTKAIKDLQTGLKANFKIKDIEPDTYLGLHIERNGNSLRLHQASYTQRILKRFGFDKAKKVPTPMTDHSLQSHEGESNIDIKRTYLEAIGSLLFLANRTRPDIEFGVNFLARFSNNPSSEHWAAVKRIFRYLAGTIDLGIHYQEKPGERFLFGYCDADFAGDLDHRKSTSGYLFILGGGPISWKSQLQRAVTLSTTEAEYAALTEATRESNSIRQLLIELGLPTNLLQPVPILEDNTSTISLASNHSNHKRSKHIDIRNHYCREQSTIGNIKVEYVNTEEQAADSLTKPLGPQKWKTVIEQLRLRTGITTS